MSTSSMRRALGVAAVATVVIFAPQESFAQG